MESAENRSKEVLSAVPLAAGRMPIVAQTRRIFPLFLCCLILGAVGPEIVGATSLVFNLDTSRISGTDAWLAFDFIDGGPPSNSVQLLIGLGLLAVALRRLRPVRQG